MNRQKVLGGQVKDGDSRTGSRSLKGLDATVIGADGALVRPACEPAEALRTSECATDSSKSAADATEDSDALGRPVHVWQADPA